MRTTTTPPSRSLCICADDFGLSAGVNAAVIDLAERGIASATSCMVRRRAWLAGARALLRIDAGAFDAGLHLDLTRPEVSGGPEPALTGLVARTWTHTAFAPGLRADIRDQFSRFEDAMHRAPAFVDGHRHVHQLPMVRELLVEEIVRRYGASPPWLRHTAPGPGRGAERLKAGLIHALGAAGLSALARRHGIPTSRRLLGVYDFAGDMEDHRQRLTAWIAASETGDVLMCHPSAGLTPGDPIGPARLREYAVLRDLVFPMQGVDGDGEVVPAPLSRWLGTTPVEVPHRAAA
ncbi:ChbG/HpnK family deacetylase [Variovorax sp. 54]|uniref:ChbG/HpnK family deacetylase n=1 Tax=Variovorax sp. 54 TaxID=2035212 RepID=UPI00211E5786|nr:ChbG/HpnK family deacetylase [Variovorax sp. 54]